MGRHIPISSYSPLLAVFLRPFSWRKLREMKKRRNDGLLQDVRKKNRKSLDWFSCKGIKRSEVLFRDFSGWKKWKNLVPGGALKIVL